MRYRAEHKQETYDRVLKVAADAIREAGPQQVSVAGVMAKAGLTHGGFYAHFASKDALIAEAIDAMFGESCEWFLRKTAALPPAEALWSYIRFYLSRQHRDAAGSGCPVAALLSDIPRASAPAKAAFARGTDRLKYEFARLLEQLGHADVDAQADTLMAELAGALMLARAEPRQKRSDAILMRGRMALKRRYGLEDLS